MKLIKISTTDKELMNSYMTPIMSYEEGLIEIIVGYGLAKERGASILNHKLNETTYWTFSPREKRKLFEEHLNSFLKESLNTIVSKIEVKNLNPMDYNSEEDYLNFIIEHIKGCNGYLYSDRLYVYCGDVIHHIDIGLLNFISWDIVNKIKNLIKIKEYEELPSQIKNVDLKYTPYLDAKKDNISSNIH
tara:strand:- start:18 stop:584 length:567 start_codon:yes stop_codon:yes gene_type:complete